MATSTTLQNVVDYTRTFGELTPVLGVSGYSLRPALDIANVVMQKMLSQPFNWKWNRIILPVFYTNCFQQDYAGQITNLAWLEHGFAVDAFNTSNPKPRYPVEVVRDIEETSAMFGLPGQACWLPNNQLEFSAWAANTAILSPSTRAKSSTNPSTQIVDANGNYLSVSTYGTTGSVTPAAASGSAAGTLVQDGTVTWVVVDPLGQGFRVNPLPPASGVIYEIHLVGQAKAPLFTSLSQLLTPLPDDWVGYFKQGFVAQCYRHSPEPSVRAKFGVEWQLFLQALDEERRAGDRERDSAGFYPASSVMSEPTYIDPGPAWPFGYTY